MKGMLLNHFRLQLFLACAGWAVLFFGVGAFTGTLAPDVIRLVRIVSFFFLALPFRSLFTILFNVQLRFFNLSLHVVIEEVSRLVFLTLTLFVFQKGSDGVLLSAVLSQGVAILCMTPLFLRAYAPLRPYAAVRISMKDVIFRHGKWALFVSYVSTLNKDVRKWLFKFILGTEAVGLFSLASSLFGHLRSLVPLGTIITPIIPQYISDTERLKRIIAKSVKYQLIGYALLAGASLVFAPPLLGFFFPNYIPSLPIFFVMLLALIPNAFAIVLTPVFYALREQKSLFNAYVVRILLTALLLPSLTYVFGMLGIAYEFVITLAVFVIGRYWLVKRLKPEISLSFKDFFSFDEYDRLIVGKLRDFFGRIAARFAS